MAFRDLPVSVQLILRAHPKINSWPNKLSSDDGIIDAAEVRDFLVCISKPLIERGKYVKWVAV